MKNEFLINIYVPKKKNLWTIFKTNIDFYELRTGIFRKCNPISDDDYRLFDFEKAGFKIIEVWSDGETIYTILEDKSIIVTGFLFYDGDGRSYQSIDFMEDNDLDEEERDFENDSNMKSIGNG